MRTPSSTKPIYQGYPINNEHQGFYPIMMERLLNCHRYATASRKRNLFFLITLTVPQNIIYHESTFPSFLEVFIRQVNRQGLAPVYFWAREQNVSQNPHFHLCLWLSGYWIRNPFGVINAIQARWNHCFGLLPEYKGLVGYSHQQPAIFLNTESADYEKNNLEVIYWASYTAKTTEKSVTPHCRVYGSSCLPKAM